MYLSDGCKGISEEEVSNKLDEIVSLFPCITEKDTFIASLTSLLANRLLNNLNISE